MKLFSMDLVLFTATAGLSIWKAKSDKTCDAPLANSAFVFVKPHANTASVQDLVRNTLKSKGVTILSEVGISGETIDEKKLIDQHYYAIGTVSRVGSYFYLYPLRRRLILTHSLLSHLSIQGDYSPRQGHPGAC